MFPIWETFMYLCNEYEKVMIKRFSVVFLKSAKDFILSMDKKTQTKIFYVVDKASFTNDPKLFKKLYDEI